ncbi:hypothetical protein BTA51_12090 [Hahella sp. CCB-MM4]|uniref:serine/threonine-protein kinase n=1 Tax=Hahella sp. (strain CCB-MM4) TaxID=1926491 RepID=UPI000B9AA8AD|nr:serine/threonine-protein kinase [Hahella sp. CCB-MM4]OZG73214.1 hypothetical protein BTA51_12090 [Hahella sp. CCB-MM4]
MLTVPGYEVYRVLGQGGMSTVFLAKHINLGRLVALKVMSPFCASDPEFCKRFETECRTVAKLNHPNIVTVYDVGVVDGLPFMAMEYLPSGDMKRQIRQGIDPETAVSYVITLAETLNYAHVNGCIHRDIKPENILFRYDGSPAIADFGVVKTLDEDNTRTVIGTVIGTPRYMSPEQAQGLPVTAESDFYSLGIILHEMLMGHTPFHGDSSVSLLMNHLNCPTPKLTGSLAKFQSLLEGLMDKIPQERLSRAQDIRKLAEECLRSYQKSQVRERWKARILFKKTAPTYVAFNEVNDQTQVWTTPVHPNMGALINDQLSQRDRNNRSSISSFRTSLLSILSGILMVLPCQSDSNDLIAITAGKNLATSMGFLEAKKLPDFVADHHKLQSPDRPILMTDEHYERCWLE